MLRGLMEIRELMLGCARKHWLEKRRGQLDIVQKTIEEAIKERRSRCEMERVQHSLTLERAEQKHRHDGEKVSSEHGRAVDLERLSQEKAMHERADRLAERRVDLEEMVARHRHELEMCRKKGNQPAFWTRLFKPWLPFF